MPNFATLILRGQIGIDDNCPDVFVTRCLSQLTRLRSCCSDYEHLLHNTNCKTICLWVYYGNLYITWVEQQFTTFWMEFCDYAFYSKLYNARHITEDRGRNIWWLYTRNALMSIPTNYWQWKEFIANTDTNILSSYVAEFRYSVTT